MLQGTLTLPTLFVFEHSWVPVELSLIRNGNSKYFYLIGDLLIYFSDIKPLSYNSDGRPPEAVAPTIPPIVL